MTLVLVAIVLKSRDVPQSLAHGATVHVRKLSTCEFKGSPSVSCIALTMDALTVN